MTKVRRPYSRVYWEALDDPKFADVWDHNDRLATWLRLLVAADMAWPASATFYAGISKTVVKVLCDVGLVDKQTGGRYRIHGLDKERQERSEYARDAAVTRWTGSPAGLPPYPNGNAHGMQSHPPSNAEGMPSQDEHSKAEHRQAVVPRIAIDHDDARWRASERQLAFLRNEITREELDELRAADAVPKRRKP
jgi:hypothetical protein